MEKINNDLKKLKSSTALIVDDDDLKQLEFLSLTLSNFFDKIITASDGIEALEKYKAQKPDVVFTDYVMPKMDGLKLCNELRTLNNNLPIVILSNYSEREKLLNIIPMKVTAYLLKPISLNVILETLQIILKELVSSKQINYFINDELSYDFFSKTLNSKTRGNIPLVKNEVKLLELFINNTNILISNEIIEDTLNPQNDLTYSAIANIIYRLRKKVGKDTIINVQSIGYILKSL